MEVGVVRHGPTLGDPDVRGDDAATLSIRDQVAVLHARPSRPPAHVLSQPGEDEAGLVLGKLERGVGVHDLDARAVRRYQLARSEHRRVLALESQTPRIPTRDPLQPDRQPVSDHDGGGRIVGGVDRSHPKGELLREELERRVERPTGKHDLCARDWIDAVRHPTANILRPAAISATPDHLKKGAPRPSEGPTRVNGALPLAYAAAWAKLPAMLAVGDQAPPFTRPDANGNDVSLSDYLGDRTVVLYFYPKDETPGCTIEACSFRDHYAEFLDAGAAVIGVSADSQQAHKAFTANHGLPFTLLSDLDNSLRRAYRVPNSLGLLPGRTTFVIDKEGVIRHVFNSQVRLRKHVDTALDVVRSLG